MEEKKYDGTVYITSAEYRELVTQAVEAEKNYEAACSARWDLERKVSALEKELAETKKELDTYKKQLSSIDNYYSQYTGSPFAGVNTITSKSTRIQEE